MKSQVIFIFVSSAAAAAVGSTFIDKDTYAKDIAPAQLAHIANYRSNSANILTGDQKSVLNQAEALIKSFDVGKIGQVEAACESAFGPEECQAILGGPGSAAAARRSPLEARGPPCSCSDRSDKCPDAHHCLLGKNGCDTHGMSLYYTVHSSTYWITG